VKYVQKKYFAHDIDHILSAVSKSADKRCKNHKEYDTI